MSSTAAPDFVGVSTLPYNRPRSLNFGIGSCLSAYINDYRPVTFTITPGARLRLSTASLIVGTDAAATATTSENPSAADYGNSYGLFLSTSDHSQLLLLCHFEGDCATVTSLGVEVSGPRTVKLAVKHTRHGTGSFVPSVNVFGSVVLDDQSPRDGNLQQAGAHAPVGATAPVGGKADDAVRAKDKTPKSRPKKRRKGDDDDDDDDAAPGGEPTDALDEPSPDRASPPLSKKQRKKLARKKAKELEEAIAKEQGYDTKKKVNSKEATAAVPPTDSSKANKAESLTRERRLDGGVLIRDIIVGAGPTARPGRKVSINYEGTLHPDGRVFDKNKSKSHPLSFRPGTGEVIKGLERGLDGMRVGGERVVTVPPKLGYGKKGSGNVIPGNSTLVFTVQLVGVGGG